MSKQLSIFSLIQPKPKRRCIVVEENSDEKLKNDWQTMLPKKLKGKKKIKLQKKKKKEKRKKRKK